ncbi:hypothetical protein CB0940_04725 [Cercospora beticola]|uniref:Uncharacterized protein n=1 Tax=Cercospora beticola TaxID=122368 RepID=A0A2G5HJX9_CERBT|nr:hypothetical protein CB0940_04725 [Cercospora beticola]PIA92864.1 hypothetical protein CB0940_04725 [Cercospora beticola]
MLLDKLATFPRVLLEIAPVRHSASCRRRSEQLAVLLVFELGAHITWHIAVASSLAKSTRLTRLLCALALLSLGCHIAIGRRRRGFLSVHAGHVSGSCHETACEMVIGITMGDDAVRSSRQI